MIAVLNILISYVIRKFCTENYQYWLDPWNRSIAASKVSERAPGTGRRTCPATTPESFNLKTFSGQIILLIVMWIRIRMWNRIQGYKMKVLFYFKRDLEINFVFYCLDPDPHSSNFVDPDPHTINADLHHCLISNKSNKLVG